MQFLNSIFPLGLFIVTALAFVILVGNASAEVRGPPKLLDRSAADVERRPGDSH